jgi:HEAT repeat protein
MEMLQSDRTPAGSTQLLLVLGNSGSPLALNTIRHFSADPSPQLRASAASSLRFIPTAEAEELLIHFLTADLAGEVRKQAATALSERTPTPLSVMAMETRIRADVDEEVRLELLRGLWRAVDRFPGIRAVVEAVTRDDSSNEVRGVAARLLATRDR